jgi:uncharacterized delta-60 repeat protein
MLKHSTFIPATFIVLLVLWALPALAEVIVDTAWVRRYNGPGNSEDEAQAIAVDSSGNVYVTGWSYYGSGTNLDYATIKYYENGDTAWVRRYHGPANFDDAANSIAIDAFGNVYVTGSSQDTTGFDYATIKYYSNGDTAWVRRYDGPANGDNVANDIAVDDSGNVYVTGYSSGSGTYLDYATIKYYPNGDTAWTRRYNGPANNYDEAKAIAVDGSGNVYVTGYSSTVFGIYYHYATIKYYPNGDTAWVRGHGGENSQDAACAIAVDGSGNAYVTGSSSSDYTTIKYYPNGDTVWVRSYDGPGNGSVAQAIAVDDSGNVYVTGYSSGSGTYLDYATIKYYPNGDTAWTRRYNGPANNDEAKAIAVDGSGNVYVTGLSYSNGSAYDFLTIKYYSNGDTAWVMRYNGLGNGSDAAQAIVVDGYGSVYVTGYSCQISSPPYNGDYATIKYIQFPSPPNRFSLLSPTNSDTVQTTVTFRWQYTGDPDPNDTLRYALYLSRSSVFNPDSVIVYDSLIDTTLTDSLAIKSWYWKVKAYDKWGELRWSNQTWSFYAFLRGDANGDGMINIVDVVYLINFLFIEGPPPNPFAAGDANCNGYIAVADVVYLINYLFIGGPPPCEP